MNTEKKSIEKRPSLETNKRWPFSVTSAFLIVLIASFMPWGTINYHYTWQFMANMEHPGLCNRILTDDDLSGTETGARLNYTATAWKSGLVLFGLFYPHWLLVVLALFLLVCSILFYFDYLFINPSILQVLAFLGVIHVVASALGFFSQGSVKPGLVLTGVGYLIFTVAFLRAK